MIKLLLTVFVLMLLCSPISAAQQRGQDGSLILFDKGAYVDLSNGSVKWVTQSRSDFGRVLPVRDNK